MRKNRFKEWKYTGYADGSASQGLGVPNFPLIDFYKKVGGKWKLASMKTTKTKNVDNWLIHNTSHLDKINDLAKKKHKMGVDGDAIVDDKVELFIFVPKLSDYTNWNSKLSKWKNVKVTFMTIEDGIK